MVTGEAPPKITNKGTRKVMWYADCDCGTSHITVDSGNLRSGNTQSCGCYCKDMTKQSNSINKHKTNNYNLTGEFGIGYTSDRTEFWFDLDDYDLIKDYCWCRSGNYIVGRILKKNKYIKLSRLVMGVAFDSNNLDVDHINSNNKFDNRKCNLRIVETKYNCRNKIIPSNNTSGNIGVSFHRKTNKWQSYITVDNKRKYLGLFDNKEDAIAARKAAEEKYFGEYSYDNSQKIASNY